MISFLVKSSDKSEGAYRYTNLNDASKKMLGFFGKYTIEVYNLDTLVTTLYTAKDIAEYTGDFYDQKYAQKVDQDSYFNSLAEEPEKPKKDAINPTHYKNVAAGKQYMELMVDMLKGKTGVEAHLFGQVYKYLMRCGSKDDEVQELKKSLWYLNALITYKQTGNILSK